MKSILTAFSSLVKAILQMISDCAKRAYAKIKTWIKARVAAW
jgi:hypothetical protein